MGAKRFADVGGGRRDGLHPMAGEAADFVEQEHVGGLDDRDREHALHKEQRQHHLALDEVARQRGRHLRVDELRAESGERNAVGFGQRRGHLLFRALLELDEDFP